uniref:hypothetical protein n=1 Tax=Persicitalea sp. TaxID=3100273 RepID=UPI0035935477
DWSGVIPDLRYKGHRYFDFWNTRPYTPTLHDAITGPVEEFMAVGMDEAAVGGQFLKIGVGGLVKPDDGAYTFSKDYVIKTPGKWKVKRKKDRVTFTHTISGVNGYGYEYTKVVRLTKGKPELVLEHSLKNTGTKKIETSTYNHNFFVIDGEPTGPNIETTFPFTTSAEGKGFGTIVEAKGRQVVYNRELQGNESIITMSLEGFKNTPDDYGIHIKNTKTGAGVKINGDRPLEKIVFWACRTTSCPEPYIRLSAKPGETVRWNIRYEFEVETEN